MPELIGYSMRNAQVELDLPQMLNDATVKLQSFPVQILTGQLENVLFSLTFLDPVILIFTRQARDLTHKLVLILKKCGNLRKRSRSGSNYQRDNSNRGGTAFN
jgi:hypothetical protein